MKKVLSLSLVLVVAFAITFAFLGVNVAYADSDPVVYTYVNGEDSFTITIIDDAKCTVADGENSSQADYVIDGKKLTITKNETVAEFEITEDNVLIDYLTDAEKTEAALLEALTKINELKAELDAISDDQLSEEVVSQKISEKLSGYLSQYGDDSLFVKLIASLLGLASTSMISIAGIYLKYRKYRHSTMGDIEKLANEKIGEALEKSFAQLEGKVGDQINEALKGVDTVNGKVNVLLQAFALSQDKSAEGKIAMLSIVQGCTEDKAVEEKIEEIKTEIVEQEAAVEEVKDKVADEYVEIF